MENIKKEIDKLFNNHIDEVTLALSLNTPEEFAYASHYAHSQVKPAYDKHDMDSGEKWANIEYIIHCIAMGKLKPSDGVKFVIMSKEK